MAKTGHSGGNEQRYKNKAQQMNIVEDQTNTANVCILRFVGILEGTNSMFACKLAATGFRGVELNEDSLSLSELAETPLDNFALPSGILAIYDLHGSYGPSEVVDLVSGGSRSMVKRRTPQIGRAHV